MALTARLLNAYRHTRYVTDCVTVRIGHQSIAMDELLAAHRARTAMFVTAWNPMSHPKQLRWNQRMQERLQARLRRCLTLPAEGVWRRWREEHVLAFAAPAFVLRLARQFRQTAVVVVKRGQAAALMTSFPVFSPVNSMPRARGAFSNPSTM